jgi:hypothetical protein
LPKFALALILGMALPLWSAPAMSQSTPQSKDPIDPPPTSAQWAALAKLPDWSGTWSPDITDQNLQIKTNPVPWKPEIQKEVDHWVAEEQAGRPNGLLINCLPHGMPGLILISHNAMEILFTPGRVTLLGESDGNRLRRIWTDGRNHSPDPDPSFHGESIGHWEGGTLAVDTIGVLPQVFLAVSEAVGIPNDGDMHITERIQLIAQNTLAFDLTIDAPHLLSHPWTTRRLYYRKRLRSHEIVEGVCREGDYHAATDANGHAIFEPTYQQDGNVLPPPK